MKMFKKLFCPACQEKVKRDWNFCPYCGYPLNRITNPIKEVKIIISKGEPRVEIVPQQENFLMIKAKKPKKVVEPKTEIKNLGNKKIVEIELKGVREDNIKVNELEHSIEIRAYSKGKLFFNVIPKKSNTSILNKYFDGKKLILEVG